MARRSNLRDLHIRDEIASLPLAMTEWAVYMASLSIADVKDCQIMMDFKAGTSSTMISHPAASSSSLPRKPYAAPMA